MGMAENLACLALVVPGSPLAIAWNLDRPTYGIYVSNQNHFPPRGIFWGDGSGQSLSDADMESLVVLRGRRRKSIEFLFGEEWDRFVSAIIVDKGRARRRGVRTAAVESA
jgi:hypothetical protein